MTSGIARPWSFSPSKHRANPSIALSTRGVEQAMGRSDGAGSRKPDLLCQARSNAIPLGWTGCEIDSRNRHVAEAELAPAPAKAAQPLSLCERAAAPPGAEDTSRPKGADRNL